MPSHPNQGPVTRSAITGQATPTNTMTLTASMVSGTPSTRSTDGAVDLHSLRNGISLRYDTGEWPQIASKQATLGIFTEDDRYQVSGEIGRGGMGAILKAFDQDLRRPVAMKVMLKTDNESHRLRFIEEAQITGQLEHPGIVPVHETGVDRQGHLYFTMKLVHGRSLADIVKRLVEGDERTVEEFTLTKLLGILVDVSNAVAFAHFRGVVHRDIKPANIMIGRFGEVLVLDWGLAKVLSNESSTATAVATGKRKPASDATARTVRITKNADGTSKDLVSSARSEAMNTLDGAVIGTPSYMSPEQARGDIAQINNRSDVYALGALLYEILTLTPPARGESAVAIISKVIHGRVDVPERRAPERDIPSELSAIAMKALRTDPRLRYPSVEAFRKDIELYLDGRAVSAKTDSAWETIRKLVRRNRAASIAIAIATVLVVSVVSVAFSMTLSDRRVAVQEKEHARAALGKVEEYANSLEQERKKSAASQRAAAPALVFQAHDAIEHLRLDDADRTLLLALSFDHNLSEAILMHAQLAIVRHDGATARSALQDYLALHPDDTDATALLKECDSLKSEPVNPAQNSLLAAILAHQGATRLATLVAGAIDKQLLFMRQQIEKAWPGAGSKLYLSANDQLEFSGEPLKAVISELSPLQGIPLRKLVLKDCVRIADLTPLKGMPLTELDLDQCSKVPDLTPIAGQRLRFLDIRNCNRLHDFSLLKGMPLEYLNVSECAEFRDLSLLKGMPLKNLSIRSCKFIADLSQLADLPLVFLDISNSEISDLSPLAKIRTLREIYFGQSKVTDLSPLAQLPLKSLYIPSSLDGPALDTLRHMPTVQSINFITVADFWSRYDHDHRVPAAP